MYKLVSFSHHRPTYLSYHRPICHSSCILIAHFFIFKANRKRADSRQTGSGPPITFTPVEELALTINAGRPGVEGIPGGTSSESPGPSPSTVNPLVECRFFCYFIFCMRTHASRVCVIAQMFQMFFCSWVENPMFVVCLLYIWLYSKT